MMPPQVTRLVQQSAITTPAQIVLTLASVPGKTVYVTGFKVYGRGATANTSISVTLAGVLGGTQTYNLAIPSGAGSDISPANALHFEFAEPIPASAPGIDVVLTVPSFGAGNNFMAAMLKGLLT